ncbi:MAG: hypothetical protein KDD42_05505, partial [Bdellovibrionales bacterium]|nr:hypothetical protein [Bdellovibrionales bacterium]
QSDTNEYQNLSREEADELVLEHRGWAESIARAVARGWNLDWQLDGLDGAAMEALIFCARRFQPARGVPFRGYARKRIHEASTDQARRSRGWRGSGTKAEQDARNISFELLQLFPELRMGQLPGLEGGISDSADTRAALRQLIVGASLIAVRQGISPDQPEEAMDFKRVVMLMADLEPVHQALLWKIYWEGNSMRNVAGEWETDELNVIREHKALLEFLQKCMASGKKGKPLKVRPGLKQVAIKLKKKAPLGEFSKLLSERSEGSP